eukprot:12927892-Alexandrium_andersonii.AAC.1
MDDARIVDVDDFEALAEGSSEGPAWPESSDGRGAEEGPRQFRDDITGAVLSPERVSAARSEEIRFMESWG